MQRETVYRCASPECPGFSWPASARPHPCPAASVGPFPQEPAPGSPEAVAQAAETLRSRVLDSAERDEVLDLLDRHRDAFEKREDELLAEVERLELREALLVNANREIREQRDALAAALKLYTDRDDCGCCDGSPDQPASGTGSCVYCTGTAALPKAGR